jgi:phage terminase large subunit-like protein
MPSLSPAVAPELAKRILERRAQKLRGEAFSPYCPHAPTPKQQEFINLKIQEAFYGGAAGGGKSDALLMAALEYVHVPGYAALILRRTYADLSLPGAIMARAHEWLYATDAKWDDKRKTYTFPSGATLTFGYLDNELDHLRYQGAEFQFIGFDELTQFPEVQYVYLFSRLRRLAGSEIPLRMRSASNPGGIGHEWVRSRFVLDSDSDRVFVPATIKDNPHLDQDEYIASLSNLDPVTLAQLMRGDWDVLPKGGKFQREFFKVIQEPPPLKRWVRYWDLATSLKQKADKTASTLLGIRENGNLVVAAHTKWKRSWPETRDGYEDDSGNYNKGIVAISQDDMDWVEALSKQHGLERKATYHVGVEAVAMQLALVQDLQKNNAFLRIPLHAQLAKGDKWQRADVAAARGANAGAGGGIELVAAPWNSEFISLAVAFTGEDDGPEDDGVDSMTGAVELQFRLTGGKIDEKPKPSVGSWKFLEDYGKKRAS